MEHIEWCESCRIGIDRIDAQHKRLFNLANIFFETLDSPKLADLIEAVLSGLLAYTKSHFADEEAVMEMSGYPQLHEHRRSHRRLTEDVEALNKRLQEGLPIDKNAVMVFLKDWLTRHVMQEDKQIGLWIQQSSVPIGQQTSTQ